MIEIEDIEDYEPSPCRISDCLPSNAIHRLIFNGLESIELCTAHLVELNEKINNRLRG